MKTVHFRERKMKCTVCGKGFGQKSNLNVHLKNVHGVETKKNVRTGGIVKSSRHLPISKKESNMPSPHGFVKEEVRLCDASPHSIKDTNRHQQLQPIGAYSEAPSNLPAYPYGYINTYTEADQQKSNYSSSRPTLPATVVPPSTYATSQSNALPHPHPFSSAEGIGRPVSTLPLPSQTYQNQLPRPLTSQGCLPHTHDSLGASSSRSYTNVPVHQSAYVVEPFEYYKPEDRQFVVQTSGALPPQSDAYRPMQDASNQLSRPGVML